jgi:hypothetical protein
MASVSKSKSAMLQNGIQARQSELQRVADVLARTAYDIKRRGTIIRIMLIVLGSVVATQGAIEKIDLLPHAAVTFLFLVFGVVIAALAGIETAFKYESRGAELNSLAASCHSIVRQADATWYKQVGIQEDEAARLVGAMQLIDMQDEKLSEVQEKAAANGVNIALEVRRQYRDVLSNDDGDIEANAIVDNDESSQGRMRRDTPYPA